MRRAFEVFAGRSAEHYRLAEAVLLGEGLHHLRYAVTRLVAVTGLTKSRTEALLDELRSYLLAREIRG